MKKKNRLSDKLIIITGLLLAAAVVIFCAFGYRYLNNWFKEQSKKNQISDASLSEEMKYELIHTQTPGAPSAAPTVTPSPEPEQTGTPVPTILPETQHEMILTPTMDPGEYWRQHTTPAPYDPNAETTAYMTSFFEAEASPFMILGVSSASASSFLSQEGINNSADMAFDGDSSTSWQEGVSGNGEKQTIKASFGGNVYLSYITFRVGNWRSFDSWLENGRPHVMTIWIGSSGYEVTFDDIMTEFCVAFSREALAAEVTFEIESVYPGSSGDTCISEISFYGRK